MSNLSHFSTASQGLTDTSTSWTDSALTPTCLVAVSLFRTLPPVFFLFGGFGNIATICVMRRIKDHNSSQHAILISLAVSDLTLVCVELPRVWLMHVFRTDLYLLHDAVCKLYNFLIYSSNTLSAWLVTCLTLQRTMAVLWPHKMRVMCTVRRTWLVIATLLILVSALYFHVFIGFRIVDDVMCYSPGETYGLFIDLYFTWIDMCVASFVPSVILIVCDVILSASLFKAVSSSSSISARVESNANTAHSTDSRRRKTSYRTTVMVLAISCTFLVLTLPVCVCLMYFNYVLPRTSQEKDISDLAFTVTHILWYANFSANFYLYCLTGTKLRREFLRWIGCGAQSPSAPSVHVTGPGMTKNGIH